MAEECYTVSRRDYYAVLVCFTDVNIIPSQIQCLGWARKCLSCTTSEELGSGHGGGTLVVAGAGQHQGFG